MLACVRNQIHVDLNITDEFFECLPVPSLLEFPTLNICIGIEFNGITVDVHYHDEPVMIMSTNLKAGSMSSVIVGGFKPNVHETIEPSTAKRAHHWYHHKRNVLVTMVMVIATRITDVFGLHYTTEASPFCIGIKGMHGSDMPIDQIPSGRVRAMMRKS